MEIVRIQSECGNMRTTKTLNTDTFHAVPVKDVLQGPKYRVFVLAPFYCCLINAWQFIIDIVLGGALAIWLLFSLRKIFQNTDCLRLVFSPVRIES